MFFALIKINGPELGHRGHGVGAQKSTHRAQVLAKNSAPVYECQEQTHNQDNQKQQSCGNWARDENNAERDQSQKKNVLQPDVVH